MTMPILVLPRIIKTKKCIRCGLRYSFKHKECSHCKGLNDIQVVGLKKQNEEKMEAASNLGKYFFYASIGIFILMVLALL